MFVEHAYHASIVYNKVLNSIFQWSDSTSYILSGIYLPKEYFNVCACGYMHIIISLGLLRVSVCKNLSYVNVCVVGYIHICIPIVFLGKT